MADARVNIIFGSNAKEFIPTDLGSMQAAFNKFGQSAEAMQGGITTKAASESKKRTAIATGEAQAYKQTVKSVEQYRQEWAGKSTEKLIAYEKQLSDQRTNAVNQWKADIIAGNTAAIAADKKQHEAASSELRSLRQVSIERPGVLHGGMGAIIGQLGIGRMGMGPLGGVTRMLSGLGPAGIAAGAGIGAAAYGMKKVIDAGSAAEDALQTFSAQSGVAGQGLVDVRHKAEQMAQTFGETIPNSVDAFRLTVNALGLGITKNKTAMMSMTEDVMTFSKAAGVDAATAASALANTFNEMGGSIANPARAATQFHSMMNVIAAAARQGNAQITDLIQSFQQVGPLAHQAGLSIQSVSAEFEVLAHSNIRGSDAGVMFRDVILGLAGATRTSVTAFKELGLTPAELDPKIHGLAGSLELLKQKLAGLDNNTQTRVMSHLFGKEAISAGYVMMNNTDLLNKYTKAITGTKMASIMAADNMKSLHAEMAKIQAELQTGLTEAFYDNRAEIEKTTKEIGKNLPAAIHTATAALSGMMETMSSLNHTLNDWGATTFSIYHSIDKFFGVENAHEKNVDALERIAAHNKAHALTGAALTNAQSLQKFIDSNGGEAGIYGTSPFDANGNPIVTSVNSPSGTKPHSAASGKGSKAASSFAKTAYQKAIDDEKVALGKKLQLITASATAELKAGKDAATVEAELNSGKAAAELENQKLLLGIAEKYGQKRGLFTERIGDLELADEEKVAKKKEAIEKAAERADEKAWQKHLDFLVKGFAVTNKLREQHAKAAERIQIKLENQSDASIADKAKRETAQEDTRYLREKMRILDQADGTREMAKQIDEQLELLEQDHQTKLADIADSAARKSAKSIGIVSKAIEQLSRNFDKNKSSAANWGEVVGAVLAALIEKMPDGTTNGVTKGVGTANAPLNALGALLKFDPKGVETAKAGVNPLRSMPGAGKIYGPGGPTDDRIPILASPGEVILPANLAAQIEASITGAQRFAHGGVVGDSHMSLAELLAGAKPHVTMPVPVSETTDTEQNKARRALHPTFSADHTRYHLDYRRGIFHFRHDGSDRNDHGAAAREQDRIYGGLQTPGFDPVDAISGGILGVSRSLAETAVGDAVKKSIIKAIIEPFSEATPLTKFAMTGMDESGDAFKNKVFSTAVHTAGKLFAKGNVSGGNDRTYDRGIPRVAREATDNKNKAFLSPLEDLASLRGFDVGGYTGNPFAYNANGADVMPIGSAGASTPGSPGFFDGTDIANLLQGKDPIKMGLTSKATKGALLTVLPDIIGAITHKDPPVQYNWDGSKKKPPHHDEALGLLGKIAPIAANLLVPGSGVILGPVLDSLGVNASGTKKSLFDTSGMLGMAGGALSFLTGLDGGGFTGGTSAGKKRPAGIVHENEFVFSSDAVDRIGVGNLDRLHHAARGYETGGYVSNYYPAHPMHKQMAPWGSAESFGVHAEKIVKAIQSQKLSITTGDVQVSNNIGTQQMGLISG